MQRRQAGHIVEPLVLERDVRRPKQASRADATTLPFLAANLEEVGKIVVEQQGDVEAGVPIAVILQADTLVGSTPPQKDRAHDVQHILFQHETTLVVVDVGIAQVDGQRRIVVTQIGAEQQRLNILEHELKLRQITGVGVEQAVRSTRGRTDIAMTIEDDEGVVVLERTPWPGRRPRHGDVERLVYSQLDDLRAREYLSDRLGHDNLGCFATARDSKHNRLNAGANSKAESTQRTSQAGSSPELPIRGKAPPSASTGPADRPR